MSQNRRRCSPACACSDAIRWLVANKHDLAPLTGTSTKALKAVAHLWQLYAYSRDEAVLSAIGLLVPSLGSCSGLARELAAWAMDWDDRERLWPRVLAFAHEQHVRREAEENGFNGPSR